MDDQKKSKAQLIAEVEKLRKQLASKENTNKPTINKDYFHYFDKSSDAILIIKNGIFVDCNQATVTMLGFNNKKELLNTHPSELSPEYQEDGQLSRIKADKMIQTALTLGSNRFDWHHKKSNGTVFPVEVVLTALGNNKNKIIHTVWRDISRRKKAEAEKEKLEKQLRDAQKIETIGTLAGGIAHDFNNILMGIFGNVSLAKMKISTQHIAYENLIKAEHAMDRATNLSNQLLTFSKGGSPIKEYLNIDELIEEVSQFDLTGSNVELIINKPKDLWLVDVDKSQMQQVFSNLTINAKQAMPNGGHLYISFKNEELINSKELNLNAGKYLKIIVKDDGIGIDSEHLDRIFEPYFSTKKTGSGLGLATCFSIIKKHAGCITVESEVSKGTIFTILLPCSKKQKQEDVNEHQLKIILKKKINILIMDDDKTILEVVTLMLEENGYQADTAINGEQAITKYKDAMYTNKPFDIVIMDLTIPGGMGGIEAIKELLAIDPKVKVIISSGYTDGPEMSNPLKYGFKAVIKKPYSIAVLIDVLEKVVLGE